ncbi:MAG: hypothetical protein KAR40_12440 [Candidatus Sabulitectum sp.]|nr:hypothetical protein [Candidatus Sabulitectum sp.]
MDSPLDHQYEYRNEQLEKVVTGEIEQIFYHGYVKSLNYILNPRVYSDDGFYLVESPEMLDSIFGEVNYPGIDTLFPEDGVLLILDYHLVFGDELTGNVFFFSDSTLRVDLTIREWDGFYDPGVWNFIFPIGITMK